MCYSLWYNAATMLPVGHRPATPWVNYTPSCKIHSSAPDDVQNNYPIYFELTGIINKPLLFIYLVVYIIYISLYSLILAK